MKLGYRQEALVESEGALLSPAQTPLRGAFSIAQWNNAALAVLMLSGAPKLYPVAQSALGPAVGPACRGVSCRAIA